MKTVCWGTSRVGIRRLRALVAGLPKESVTWRPEQAKHAGDWTAAEHLLALLTEKVHDLLRVTHAAVPRKKGSGYRPIPALHIPRPGAPTRPKAVPPAALARAMTGRS